MKRIALLCLLAIGLYNCRARLEPPAGQPPALIPQPLQAKIGAGQFFLGPGALFLSAGVDAGNAEWRETNRLLGDLQAWLKRLGWDERHSSPPDAGLRQATVLFALEPGERQRLGEEGYALSITGGSVILTACRPAGLFYGAQTLRQLVLGRLDARHGPRWPLALPCLEIVDRPRFSWRGFMLDCCRHFFPKEFVKECLDEMALFKLNRFHWHLTDDQAWRIEIARRPELTRKGGAAAGGFYSREDIREIVAYAAERFITVVPEIEMPGHATAALSVYPGLSCTGGPFAAMPQWGVFADVYCAGSEETFAFLNGVLEEVAELFPGPWVHVGGDECPKDRWNACARCQARLRAEGLDDAGQLQSWFVRRVGEHLRARGKRLVGWDEILEGGLPPDATVMSWRGSAGGIEAARQGHDVVMAPTTSNYLDYYQGDPRFEPAAIGGFLPLRTVYAFAPCPAELTAEEAAHVLGGQANLWTEYIATPGHASYMMWPRLCALAEAVWSPAAAMDWDSFLRRLGALRPGLKSQGVSLADTEWRPSIAARPLPGEKGWRIEMACGALGAPGAKIRYRRDGIDPGPRSKAYRRPFALSKGSVLRAALFDGREPLASPSELPLRKHLAAFARARVSSSGRLRPEKGGEALLVDGLDGSLSHKDGAWLGAEGGDLEAVIDLGSRREVSRVSARFLAHPAAWIFLPQKVEVAVSLDGRRWSGSVAIDWPFDGDFTVLNSREAVARFLPLPSRYVRLTARGIGACPPGHVGAGGKAWLFLDEIIVD